MTVFAIMPVFNRVEMTKSMLACLEAQRTKEKLAIIIVDDGSSDGTHEFLKQNSKVTVLQGDGSLWWGGSIQLGWRYVEKIAVDEDWILLINNDLHIKPDFLENLICAAKISYPAVVGSVIMDCEAPFKVLSIGPLIDCWSFRVGDAVNELPFNEGGMPSIIAVDAVSGRGSLYPVSAMREVSGMRPGWLPHYLADYELSIRAKKNGYNLVISPRSVVYSREIWGNSYSVSSVFKRIQSIRSPYYLPAQIMFWWTASSALQKLTIPLRLILFTVAPFLRKDKYENCNS